MTQRLGDGRAGRDGNWRRMENEGRRQEKIRGTAPEKSETEIIDIVGTTENTTKRRGRGGTQEMEKWGICEILQGDEN